MLKLKGGLKLRHTDKLGFQPIYDMIESPGATVEVLTVGSLKGFMFILNVLGDAYEYNAKNEKGNFTVNVRSYILKFVVISPNGDDNLDDFTGPIHGVVDTHPKATESNESIFDEAKLQMNIWENSIKRGKPEICPSVANLSIFDFQNSENLLNFFISRTNGETQDVMMYLLDQIQQHSYTIGIITMLNIDNSTTFNSYQDSSRPSQAQKDRAFAYLAAQTLRLFLRIKVLHMDLHDKNSLVVKSTQPIVRLIDFGRASKIDAKDSRGRYIKDEFFKPNEKARIDQAREDFLNELESGTLVSNEQKRAFVKRVLEYIREEDRKANGRYFGWNDPSDPDYRRYQMQFWLEDYFSLPNNVMDDTFKILSDLTVIEMGRETMHSEATINKWKKDGDIINFNGLNYGNFIVPFTDPIAASPIAASPIAASPVDSVKWDNGKLLLCAAGVCTAVVVGTKAYYKLKEWGLMGGKSKRHKRKHHNKTKRH